MILGGVKKPKKAKIRLWVLRTPHPQVITRIQNPECERVKIGLADNVNVTKVIWQIRTIIWQLAEEMSDNLQIDSLSYCLMIWQHTVQNSDNLKTVSANFWQKDILLSSNFTIDRANVWWYDSRECECLLVWQLTVKVSYNVKTDSVNFW